MGSFEDSRLKSTRHDANRGLAVALNTGFSKSTGSCLTWTSDDNFYASDAIEKMVDQLDKTGCSFVYCDFLRFVGNDTATAYPVQLPFPPVLENENTIGACFMYLREVWSTIGDYDSDLALAEDYDYWIRISKRFRMCHINVPLYYYQSRDHPGSDRQFEVQLVSLLVLLRNNMIDTKTAISRFVTLTARRGKTYGNLSDPLAAPMRLVSERLVWLKVVSRAREVFEKFREGRMNAPAAKTALRALAGRI